MSRSEPQRKTYNVKMRLRLGVDPRTILFGLVGLAWTTVVILLHLSWPWFWGLLVIVIAARLAMGRRVRALAFCVCALAPGVVMSSYFLAMPPLEDWWHHEPFDSKMWKQDARPKDIMWPARLCMVDDLLSRNDLHGWERPRVIEILGEPDATRWGDKDGQMVYELGPERDFIRIDSEWLVIALGQDGKVSDYRLARD